jgi:methionyl-tRNA synthetase
MLDRGGAKMSKTRGNVLDPDELADLLGVDGVRYVVLREVPFDRDADVSWGSFIRRYNADLANDFGNLLNRTLNMTSRYLDGERVAPWPAADSVLGRAWAEAWAAFARAMEGYLLHDALAALWEFVGAANRHVDAEQPWQLAKAARDGDAAATEVLRGVLGDLLEACRLVSLAAAPFMPSVAARVSRQLGLEYGYDERGDGGSPLTESVAWGAEPPGRTGAPEILFPRIDAATDE